MIGEHAHQFKQEIRNEEISVEQGGNPEGCSIPRNRGFRLGWIFTQLFPHFGYVAA